MLNVWMKWKPSCIFMGKGAPQTRERTSVQYASDDSKLQQDYVSGGL